MPRAVLHHGLQPALTLLHCAVLSQSFPEVTCFVDRHQQLFHLPRRISDSINTPLLTVRPAGQLDQLCCMHTRITMRRHHIVVKRLLSHDCWSHGPQRHATPSSAKLNNLWQTGPQRHGQPKKFSHVRLLHLFCYCTMSAGCHSDFFILLLWKCLLNVIRIGYCTYSLHPDRNVTGRKVDTKNTCYLVHVLYILTWSCVLVVPICAIEPNATDIKRSDSPKSKRDPTYLTKYFYRTTKYHSSNTKYTSSTTNYYEVLLQYYKVLSNTTKYYKVLLRITKDYSSTTKYWTFSNYCACHEKWHLTFTKYCTCHKKWHSTFTKYCACHEKCNLTFTKYCACHEKWHLTFTKSCACHEKSHLTFTKYCAYHEQWHSSFTKYCACHAKWHLNFTKYCACHAK